MNPKGSQFEAFGEGGPRAVFHQRQSHASGYAADTYTYAKEAGPDYQGDRWTSQQSLMVSHHPPEATYDYGHSVAGGHLSDLNRGWLKERHEQHERYAESGYTSSRESAHMDLLSPIVKGGQQKLFGSHHEPGRSEVYLLEGTHEAKAMAPTMLGIAQNQTMRERGRGLTPSTDLSQHSAGMVSHLQKKGVIGGEAPEVTNTIGFRAPLYMRPYDIGARLPHEEVMAGRRTGRAALRSPKPTPETPKPRYQQQALPL